MKKELANPKHPFHQFCIGNKQTLAKISQEELKQWYSAHYSADLMHLVIYSPLPIDILEKKVVDLFSQVQEGNSPTQAEIPRLSLLSEQTQGKIVSITPMQELQTLELTWELPISFGEDRDVKADDLLSYVLGHEGEQSLLTQLKNEELADSLSSGTYRAGKNQCLFHISIRLTSKGISQYETVIQRCFEALASFRKNTFPEYLFNEISQLKTLHYTFQERENVFRYVADVASGMVDEPLETYPRKTLMPTSFKPEKIKELLHLMTPEKCHFTMVASPKLSHMKTPSIEKWMGVSYGIAHISQQQISQWMQAQPHPTITFPNPNRFIPQQVAVREQINNTSSVPTPTLIIDKEESRFYYCRDDHFLVPEITWNFNLKTPEIRDGNPRSHVLADLYCHTVKERLNTIAYEAELAGLSYQLSPTHNGIKLSISGYSEKAPEFLETIIKQIVSLEPTKKEFALYKELAEREYTNAANKTPVTQGIELMWSILYKEYTGVNEKEKAIQTISYEDFKAFCQRLFKVSYIEGTLYGNLSEEEGKKIATQVENLLQPTPYPRSSHPAVELALLPEGKDPSFLIKKSSLPGNVVILTADCGDFSFSRRAAHEILSKGLEEPFFSELRTKQQTAYLVANWSQEIERHLYSFFLVQSGTHDTRDLLARFELFLESSLLGLNNHVIPKERFEAIRSSLITHLEHPAQKIEKMGDLLHSLAFDYDADFTWLDKRIQGLKELTYAEFQDYATQFLGKVNRRRMAVCINGALASQDRFHYRRLTTPQKIRSEIHYQARVSQELLNESILNKAQQNK